MHRGRILRQPTMDEPAEPGAAPPRVLRGVATERAADAEDSLPRVLRGDHARVSADAFDVSLEALQPDFPIPQQDGQADLDTKLLDPDRIRAQVETEWQKKLEEAVLRVREEAYDAGYHTAKDEMLQSIEEARTDLEADAARMKSTLEDFMKSLEPQAVTLALDAAETVMGSPLTDRARAEVERSLAATIEDLAGDGAIDISLHPVDLLRLQENGFEEQLSSAIPGLRWHPDESMEEGDWSARSSQSVVRRLRKEMIKNIKRRLGIDSAIADAV